MTRLRTFLLRHQLAAFFGLAYAISWMLWLPPVVGRLGSRHTWHTTLLLFLGGFGPFLSAVLLTGVERGLSGVKTALNRLLLWRVGLGWYLVAFYGFPVYGLAALVLFGVAGPRAALSELPVIFLALPLNTVTRFLIAGPLGEELGWRGYALPRLLARSNPLVASAALGFLWAYWHAPLMLVPDWRGSVTVVLFVTVYPLTLVALTLIFCWAYLGTRRSLLITMLLHASYNATLYLFDEAFQLAQVDSWAAMSGSAVLLWAAAIVLLLVKGPDMTTRE